MAEEEEEEEVAYALRRSKPDGKECCRVRNGPGLGGMEAAEAGSMSGDCRPLFALVVGRLGLQDGEEEEAAAALVAAAVAVPVPGLLLLRLRDEDEEEVDEDDDEGYLCCAFGEEDG